MLLPRELDSAKPAGYAEGGGSTKVLVPGHHNVHGFELPERCLVEVIASPYELANAYLIGKLGRLDRRWRYRGRYEDAQEQDAQEQTTELDATGPENKSPETAP